MKCFCALAVLVVLGAVQGERAEDVIEPKLTMVDRSPPIARSPHSHQFAHPDAGTVDPNYEEGVSFSVNTRGELGPDHAPLFCNCRVLTSLMADSLERDEYGEPLQRQSYTAPQLREHVPLVTTEYAQTNDQISFGVNVRGEEGSEFAPTWCTCQILQHTNEDAPQSTPSRHAPHGAPHTSPQRPHGRPQPTQATESDSTAPHRASGPHRPAPPHVTQSNIQLEEDKDSVESDSLPLTPSELATQTMNLQLTQGITAQSTATTQMPSELKVAQSTAGHHRFTRGVTHEVAHEAHAAAQHTNAHMGATQYSYRGRRFSQLGDRITEVHASRDAPQIQMLAELDEGSETNTTASSSASASPSQSMTPSSSPSPSNSPSLSPSPSPSPSPSNDDNDSDPITALRHIAIQHPHASALLAQALQTAAAQKQSEIDQLESAVHKRDDIIHQLTEQNERIQEQLKELVKIEEERLMTPSPSVTPSPSGSPSPSPSPLPSFVPVPPQPHHSHRRHSNGQACYHKCRDTTCAPLFESSLHQFGACMDKCAATCYGGRV